MQHLPLLDVTQRAVRARICTKCIDRPPQSEKLSPEEPRTCEPDCTVFKNLPKLLGIAARFDDPVINRYEAAVRELVCQNCAASPTSGDYCADRTTAHCPLSRYLVDVIDVLERVEMAHN